MTTLGFYGGVGTVTGANFLLDTGAVAVMVDCGLVQGDRFAQEVNSEAFAYNPEDIDVLFVTHAHADHIGRIPKLVKDGFRGDIYSTIPTKELSRVMFTDALKIMVFEKEKYGNVLIYDESDVQQALTLWKGVEYEEHVSIGDQMTVWFTDAGHILGSGMVNIERNGKKVVFTGDIGNVPQPLLAAPVIPTDYDYLVMESVYGDRVHEEVEERTELLKQYIESTQAREGTLIIPAFSLERTQGMLLEINNLVESKQISPLPVFLDSPLAIAVTDLYRNYTHYFSQEVQDQITNGDDIFYFEGLSFTHTLKESNEIQLQKGAKIIIAGSGMSHGGRIRIHEKRYLGDKNTTLLLVGYQAVGSLGRVLHDGAKKVTIDGEEVTVRAQIARIRGYSGHADRDQLVNLVAAGADKVKKVFVTMGEERASLFLVQRLRDYVGIDSVAPSQGEEIEIDF